jgi:hypothetical protein
VSRTSVTHTHAAANPARLLMDTSIDGVTYHGCTKFQTCRPRELLVPWGALSNILEPALARAARPRTCERGMVIEESVSFELTHDVRRRGWGTGVPKNKGGRGFSARRADVPVRIYM